MPQPPLQPASDPQPMPLQDGDTLPVLVLQLLRHFLQRRPCWKLNQHYNFRRYPRREVSQCLQALTTIGLVAKVSQTSGSQFITTPPGRLLLERYRPPETPGTHR